MQKIKNVFILLSFQTCHTAYEKYPPSCPRGPGLARAQATALPASDLRRYRTCQWE